MTSCSHPGVRPTSSLSSPTPVRGLCPVRFSTSYSAYSLLSSTHLWGPSVFSFLIAACSDSACFPNPSCPLRARPAPPPGSPPWGAPAPQLRVSCEEIGSPPCLQSSLAPASWGAAGALLHEGRKRGIQAASVAASCRPGSGAAGRPRAPEQDCADLPRPSHLPSSSPLAHLTSPRVCGSPLGCSILLHP